MNWIKFFTREELVAGLEISGDYLRLALLSPGKEKNSFAALTGMEEPLKKGTLVNGRIADKEEFTKSVKELIGKSKTKIRYVVLSIPDSEIFFKVFKFPKTIKDEKLKGTMDLSIGFQLPIKPDDAYLDWEKVEKETGEENEVLLAAITKPVVNDYVTAIESAGLKIVAVEFHLLSVSRVLPKTKETVLALISSPEGVTAGVIKNNSLLFIHTVSYATIPEDKLSAELKRIINFCEVEYGVLDKALVFNEEIVDIIGDLGELKVEVASISKTFTSSKEPLSISGNKLVSVGAATRGSMPRKEDSHISLMPLGTEEAYEYHKAITYSKLVTELTISVSLVFLTLFLGAWFLMTHIQQSLNDQRSLSANIPVPRESAALEARATHLNSLLSETTGIIETTPQWGEVVKEITDRTVADVAISRISIGLPEVPITLQGIAKSREAINNLSKSFQESDKFTAVNIPLTDLGTKEDISFSMSFQLKDPQSIYLK